MKKHIKIIVLRAAGTNCDNETAYAFELASNKLKISSKVDIVHINQLISKEVLLEDFQILALPGGFSYGDDIASGKIFANELKFKLKNELLKFVKDSKLIIGICNGFQVLVNIGILPGKTFSQTSALIFNDSGKFEDRWVYLKSRSKKCIFTKGMNSKIIYLPVAHGEGKFVTLNKKVLNDIIKDNLIVFEYVTKNGKKAVYPENPNGSMYGIAGICNKDGNVFGLMPHPERYMIKYQHPRWTREDLPEVGDGFEIFKNAIQYARKLI